uniref:Uncharacterized protein n=1 Tax=Acrobeloides nanus TaxID=290746 RepID=A0A914C851_9BILA
MIIGSSAQFDQCGVCGGNGESCGRNVFRWKDTQQFSPCDKTCGPDSYRVSVSICWNIISERVVPERLCADQPRPRPQVRKCPYVVCPAKWMTSPWKDCSVSCGGGYQTRDVFCVETYQDTSNEIHDGQNSIENRKVADQYCWETKRPTTERQCAIDECPGWEKGEWSQCSVTCDKGIRKRMVECRQNGGRVEPTLCLVDEKPTEKQSCYTDVSCKAVKAFDGANLLNYDRYR